MKNLHEGDLVLLCTIDEYDEYIADYPYMDDEIGFDDEMKKFCNQVVDIKEYDAEDDTFLCAQNGYWYPAAMIKEVVRRASNKEDAPASESTGFLSGFKEVQIEPITEDGSNIKVGDKVLIRPDLKGSKTYGREEFITPEMNEKLNQIVTIEKFDGEKRFKISNNSWWWTPEMCVGKVVEEQETEQKEVEIVKVSKVSFEDLREGMKVHLRDDLEEGEWYGGETFTAYMLSGEDVIIESLYPRIRKFTIKQKHNNWDCMLDYTAEMIDHIVEEAKVEYSPEELAKEKEALEKMANIDIFPPSDMIIKADTNDLFGIAKEVVNMLDNTGLDSLDKEKVIRMVKEYYK